MLVRSEKRHSQDTPRAFQASHHALAPPPSHPGGSLDFGGPWKRHEENTNFLLSLSMLHLSLASQHCRAVTMSFPCHS